MCEGARIFYRMVTDSGGYFCLSRDYFIYGLLQITANHCEPILFDGVLWSVNYFVNSMLLKSRDKTKVCNFY